DIGVFFCWGVKGGLAEGNQILDNRSYGVSIGHRDTNNVVRDNEIGRSGKVGVLFRPERGRDFAPHRKRIERNKILDTGPADGVAVDVQGQTESIAISENEIRESREPMSRIGIRIGAETADVRLTDNRVDGFSAAIADLHAAK